MSYEELEDRLRRNLAKHTETCRARVTSRGAHRAASYAEYERRRATIYDEYTRPPHQLVVDDVERVECKVKDDLFASARRQVDESLSTLQKFVDFAKQDGSDVTKQLPNVFRALTCVQDLTKTWHCEEHYYCAEYFADHNGYRLVLQAYDTAYDLAPQMDMHRHALELFWNCGSTRRARLAQYQQGVMPFILQGLNSGDFRELASALGALWGLSELSQLPAVLVEQNLLSLLAPVIDPMRAFDTSSGELAYLQWLALGTLQCICANVMCYEKALGLLESLLFTCTLRRDDVHYEHATVMIKFFGYNAIGSLCLHVLRKSWMESMVGVSGSVGSVHVTKEQISKSLKAVMSWIDSTNAEKIIEHELGGYLWLWMRPFTALLYGIHPVLRRLGAFTLSCLLAGPDSRRIFEAEEGRGYDPIQCTAWCRDAKAKEYAVSAMNRITCEKPSPPSLVKICCFYVSDNYDQYSETIRTLPRNVLKIVAPFEHSD